MEIQKIAANRLNPAAYNPRKDLKPGDKEYEKLKRSIAEFGYVEPVIWNRQTGNVVGGHQRLKVMKDLGYTEVDCVVVSAHWGVEDTHVVTDAVKALAQDLIDWGADVVIGTGPHTLQTMEYLTRPDGTQGFVYYSLGNFISGQTDNFNMVGGMAKFDITMTDGTVTIENPTCTPIITQYETGGLKDVRVIPYYLYTDELVENHGVPYSPVGTQKSWSWDIINTIIEENVPEAYRRLEK